MQNTRVKYVHFLEDILSNKCSFSEIKGQIFDEERNFANMLLMTALRQLTFIKNEILPQFVHKKIPNKQKIMNCILYLGATELLFLKTPEYAIINSYTDVTKTELKKFEGNFVNAVLRNIARQKDELLKTRKSLFFSKDFRNLLKQDYTAQQIAQMEHFAAIEPALNITVKKDYKPTFDGYILPFNSIGLPSNTKVTDLNGFHEGNWWVQDVASSVPVKCLKDLKNKKVLDLCAAPGGKTAQLLDAGAQVTAVDISQKRMDRLIENIDRLGLSKNLSVIVSDALQFNTDEKFDIILIDAPCSATGTYRRHPEIMHTKTVDDVRKQVILQKKILENSIQFLAPLGIIVYATCSLAKLEGELQIKSFLKNHTDFDIVPVNLPEAKSLLTKDGYIRILPGDLDKNFGNDGFFVAILQRKI